MDDAERIREVLPVEIPAQLAGRDPIVGDLLLLDQSRFDPIVGTDIIDLITCLAQGWKQCDIRRNMAGSSAAGQDDFFSHNNRFSIHF